MSESVEAMVNVDIMPDASEVVHYDETGVPLYVRRGILSLYPEMQANCHWHEDLEWIYITRGEMRYFIDGTRILLCEGDALFVNSKQMHYGYANNRNDCAFLCILIHPTLITGNQPLYRRLVEPLISDAGFSLVHFKAADPDAKRVAGSLQTISRYERERPFGYELETVGMLSSLLTDVLKRRAALVPGETSCKDKKLMLQREMVAYIAAHYTEEISLDEIAAGAAVSKSTCCRLFKDYLRQSPCAFLNAYRLEASCNRLTETGKSITEIATLCGFNHVSYYTKLFTRRYGCPPKTFREQKRKKIFPGAK